MGGVALFLALLGLAPALRLLPTQQLQEVRRPGIDADNAIYNKPRAVV